MSLPGFAAENSLYRARGYQTLAAGRVGTGSPSINAQIIWGPGGGPPLVGRCTPYCLPCQGGTRLCVDASCRMYAVNCISIPSGWLGGGGLSPGDGGGGGGVIT